MSKTYSFQQVVATLVAPTGQSVSLGYGAQVAKEGITIEASGDKNTLTVGADGSPMHTLHADKTAHITVRLQKTSPTNAVLQSMYDEQQTNGALWGQNTITVQQTQSGDIHTCANCAFKRKARVTYSNEGDMLEWEFDVGALDSVLGTY